MPKSSTDKRHFAIVGVLVVVTTVVMGLLLNGVLPLPEPGVLFRLHMWLIAILFALVVVLMVYSFYVFRRGKRTDDGEHFEGNTTLEVDLDGVPLVLVVIFSFIGIADAARDHQRPATSLCKSRRRASSGRGPSATPNGVTSAELVLPVNKSALISLPRMSSTPSGWRNGGQAGSGAGHDDPSLHVTPPRWASSSLMRRGVRAVALEHDRHDPRRAGR
jgi:hypothetical protein